MKNTSYKSEAMEFIRTLLNKPGTHEQQIKLRSTWWDKGDIDQQEQQEYTQSTVKNHGYVYFSYPKHQK